MKAASQYSKIVRNQCERTTREYYAFRRKGGTANDLVEIPAMRRLIGDVEGKKVIDCGCGFGSYSVYCAQRGANVTAVDISATMIDLAKQEAVKAAVQIEFHVLDVINMLGISSNIFDMAISSVSVCFNMPVYFKEIARVLKPNGVLCFSEVHPMQENDNYFDKGIRKAKNVFGKLNTADPDYEWQWEHYTLEDYFMGLEQAGFFVEAFLEPKPVPEAKELNPNLYGRATKRPIFFLNQGNKNKIA